MSQRRIHIEPEKPAVHAQYHHKGQHCDEHTAEYRYQPQRDARQKSHLINGGFELLRQCYRCAGKVSEISCHRADDAAADGKQRSHDVHAIGHSGFRCDKTDKVSERLLRSAEVLKICRAAENADGEEQDKQPIADGLQCGVDILAQLPYCTAFEMLRRFAHQRPYLCESGVPCGKCTLQIFHDPVVVQVITSRKGQPPVSLEAGG